MKAVALTLLQSLSRLKKAGLYFVFGFLVNAITAAALSFLVVTTDGRVGSPLAQASPWTPEFQQEIQPYKCVVMSYIGQHTSVMPDDLEITKTDHRRRLGWDTKYIDGGVTECQIPWRHGFRYEERRVGLPLRSAQGKLLRIFSSGTTGSQILTEGMVRHPWALHAETVGGIVWRPTLGALPNSLFYALILWLFIKGRNGTVTIIRGRGGRCTACGYDLNNIASTNCPECGSDQGSRFGN